MEETPTPDAPKKHHRPSRSKKETRHSRQRKIEPEGGAIPRHSRIRNKFMPSDQEDVKDFTRIQVEDTKTSPSIDVPKPKGKPRTSSVDDPKAKGFCSRIRLDLVVLAVLISLILGCTAVSLEWHVYQLDQHWNKVINGQEPVRDAPGGVFFEMKLHLPQQEFLDKAEEYANRNEPLEIVFMIALSTFMGLEVLHMFVHICIKERYSALLILLYACGGALCIFSSTFLVTAAVNIENNYAYAIEMLYNFQHLFDGTPPLDPEDDECKIAVFANGCAAYERAKHLAAMLEKIFRVCGDASRYYRYYNSEMKNVESVELEGKIYAREDLKRLGFCNRDGYKFTAALLSILMGLVCSAIPIVYCCCTGKRDKKSKERRRSSEKRKEKLEPLPPPSHPHTHLPPRPSQPNPPPLLSHPPPPHSHSSPPQTSDFSEPDAIQKFKEYVEKESDEDLKDSMRVTRASFKFKRSSRDPERRSHTHDD